MQKKSPCDDNTLRVRPRVLLAFPNLPPRAMPVCGLGLAMALGERKRSA